MSMQWGEGYVTDLEYTTGYYGELNPSLLRFACLYAGFQPPAAGPLTYLELGYGLGVTLNVHAAVAEGSYWGTDFNPAHASRAMELARASGSGVQVLNDSFSELLTRTDLPDFDIITLHGIWSWVSDANRQAIVDILRRKLKVGGIVYISYNCDPGWAALQPLRHLLYLHSQLGSAPSAGALSTIEQALAFAGRVEAAGAKYFQNNPSVGPFLKGLSGMNRNYLIHEYFNANWQPMPFSEIVECLTPARLDFVASANLGDHIDTIALNDAGRQLIAETQNRVLRESLRDYVVHQRFRRDVFGKGLRPLSAVERLELLDRQSIVLKALPSEVPTTVTGPFFEGTLQREVYGALAEVLAADDHAPKTFADLRQRLGKRNVSAFQIAEAVAMLTATGHVVPAEPATKETIRRCKALNRSLCEGARRGADIPYLVSPVAGTVVSVPRLQQCFMLCLAKGRNDPGAIAGDVWDMLSALGQSMLKDGTALEGRDANVAELERQAREFVSGRLPLLRNLGVALA